MNPYYISNDKVKLNYYPCYSFEIGDVDGDGKMEFISMNQSGNQLQVHNLEGELLFEKELRNIGTWGTPIICVFDINGDGCDEVIVPNGESIIALDKRGNITKEHIFEGCQKDAYGICVPLLGAASVLSSEKPSLIAAVASGIVYALDNDFNTIWKVDGLRRDFGHEIHFADIDGDGFDEIAFCTVDDISAETGADNVGDLVLLDHDGTILLRKRVDALINDTHFDDIAMSDFLGDGTSQVLVEKGLLLDISGNIIWDLSDQMEHGQWIAHTHNPNGKGRLCFISELWGGAMKSMLFTGQGKKIKDISDFAWVKPVDKNNFFIPTRCHTVNWESTSAPEIFFTQQGYINYEKNFSHYCDRTRRYKLNCLFMDIHGNQVGELPFDDMQIEGYFYNGETHSKVADVDGDGQQEIVFPKQDGRIMIIKKRV